MAIPNWTKTNIFFNISRDKMLSKPLINVFALDMMLRSLHLPMFFCKSLSYQNMFFSEMNYKMGCYFSLNRSSKFEKSLVFEPYIKYYFNTLHSAYNCIVLPIIYWTINIFVNYNNTSLIHNIRQIIMFNECNLD